MPSQRQGSPAFPSAIAAVWLALALPLSAQNASVDVLHYRVELTLPADDGAIEAVAELTVRPVSDSLESLKLDFAGLTIDGVTVNGKAARYERTGDRLTIATRRHSADPFRVAIRYHGKPKDGLLLRETSMAIRPRLPTTGRTAPISGFPRSTTLPTRPPSSSSSRLARRSTSSPTGHCCRRPCWRTG